ncbi:iron chaperone [Modestobacter sp. DSM 44400]|uniref:iron chaperone n=1 Tax=Modestobacter sp. DSM 44400 TaxID=1550230 RepID=UPI000B89A107|nr:DUF1801 domain-containing protein [Modestobacter sp. DSM 44400]
MPHAATVTTVDEYIGGFPPEVAARLEEVRQLIRSVVPAVRETISYKMPTFTLDGRPLVHMAGWKNHIGLYPLPPMDDELAAAVAPYRSAKNAMNLPHAVALPRELLARVIGVLVERQGTSERGPRGTSPTRAITTILSRGCRSGVPTPRLRTDADG